jgi:DNA polymerase III alpha subunit
VGWNDAAFGALVAAFPTYRTRGAIRDFGKALGIPQTEIERAARSIDFHGSDDLQRDLAQSGALLAFVTANPTFELGSPEGKVALAAALERPA